MALRIHNNSPVVLWFSLLATIVYLINTFTGGLLMPLFSRAATFNAANPLEYLTLFTYVLGHDFPALDHLLGNLTFLLLLGPILEEKYGSRMVLAMILFTALITAIFNILFLPTGIVGASGIVFMFIILVSFTNVRSGSIPITFILIIVLFLGKEVISSFNQDNISQFGHIMGGLIGGIFGFVLAPRKT